jgi:uncharacterized membrane protein
MTERDGLERRQRRRRSGMTAGAIILVLVILQGLSMTLPIDPANMRAVTVVRLVAFGFLALVLALRSTTAFSIRGRDPRLDDELVRANRASAAKWGYLSVMIAGLAVWGVSVFAPLRVVDVAPLLLMVGAFVAAMVFVRLERRGETDD